MMPIMTVNDGSEVVVVGAGPAGLTTAIALAQAGLTTTLVAREAPADHRTTALLAGSITALETLGVWNRCAGQAAPLKVMRIVDATVRLIRAPEVHFSAEEIGLDAFGYNIEDGAVHVHDLHATLLHLCGFDHERLTYRFQGRDFRLTDIHGNVIRDILA